MAISESQRVPLDQAITGARVVIRALNADQETNGRLMLHGVVIGAPAEVLQSNAPGPVLIRVRSTLVALGREEARKVIVELCA